MCQDVPWWNFKNFIFIFHDFSQGIQWWTLFLGLIIVENVIVKHTNLSINKEVSIGSRPKDVAKIGWNPLSNLCMWYYHCCSFCAHLFVNILSWKCIWLDKYFTCNLQIVKWSFLFWISSRCLYVFKNQSTSKYVLDQNYLKI